jgi:branched-chain amino acid transport system ATP-binding protein
MLKVEGLEVKYGAAAAVHGVNLSVDEDQCVLLVGPNGAGKSSILKAISGLVRPSAGTIQFQGTPIQSKHPNAIVRMGLIHCPEGRHLFPQMSVLDNLRLGAFTIKDRAQFQSQFEQVLEWFPVLKDRLHQQAVTLSGGEQQMLAIGRALMSRPKLLLLDEPSLGLSIKMKQSVFSGVETIRKSGITIVLVEQDVYSASKISDYMYVMTAGKVSAEGKPSEVLSQKEFMSTYLGTLAYDIQGSK